MSSWTHIYALLKIEQIYNFEEDDKQFKCFREKIIELIHKGPLITGLEGNADIIPIKFSRTVYLGSEDDVNCVYIAIIGNLRDRTLNRTNAEFCAFVDYLKNTKYFEVEELCCSIGE